MRHAQLVERGDEGAFDSASSLGAGLAEGFPEAENLGFALLEGFGEGGEVSSEELICSRRLERSSLRAMSSSQLARLCLCRSPRMRSRRASTFARRFGL